MYAKIVRDDTIMDAVPKLDCCKFSKRSGIVLRCAEKDNPSGIISERTGSIYQVDGWPLFPETVATAGTVTIVWIEEEEYKELLLALDTTGTVPDPDDAVEESTEPDAPKILSRQMLTEEVTRLSEQNATLMEQNQMLLECLLEMSEAVYA